MTDFFNLLSEFDSIKIYLWMEFSLESANGSGEEWQLPRKPDMVNLGKILNWW